MMATILRHRQSLMGTARSGYCYDTEEQQEGLLHNNNNKHSTATRRRSSNTSRSSSSWLIRNISSPIWLIQLASFLLPATVLIFYLTVDGKQRLTSSMPPSSSSSPHYAVLHNSNNNNNDLRSSISEIIIPVVLPTRTTTTTITATTASSSGGAIYPLLKRKSQQSSKRNKDYGDIHFRSITEEKNTVFARSIATKEEDKKLNGKVRPSKSKYQEFKEGDQHRYLHFDEVDYRPEAQKCYAGKWTYEYYPNCNVFHEIPLERSVNVEDTLNVTLLGRGHFRSGWKVGHRNYDDLVLKTTRIRDDAETISSSGMSMTQREAVTMLATAGSNRTTNIYGHCSHSVAVEFGQPFRRKMISTWGFVEQKHLDEISAKYGDDVQPMNDFTPEEKLSMSLHMAEGLADMHGNEKGVIVNHDISLDQWVIGKDGIIKLNDFNKAKLLQWNAEEGKYCKFRSQQTLIYYAPEEMKGSPVDESADVHTFGKILYIILTGLKPYYHLHSHEEAVEAIHNGEYPYVDPRYKTRSYIEGRLVEIMEKTWKREPDDRPSIFSVIAELRDAARSAGML